MRCDVSGAVMRQNDSHLSLSFYRLLMKQRERAAAQTAKQLNNVYN